MSTQVFTQFNPGHIGLNVRDLARSRRFYQDVFGFDLAGESNHEGRIFAFLAQNNAIVLTLWNKLTSRLLRIGPACTIWRSKSTP
jgi:lactoylglutathione lyase